MQSLPSQDPHDPGYRRLRYVRYADDHLLGFTGPKAEAEEIKQRRGPHRALHYAQPVTRIRTLTVDDIALDDDGAMLLRLGDPPAPVPDPFAALTTQLLAQRRPDTTSRWLFPGRHPGQPLNYVTLAQGLRDHGVPLRHARAGALRQLVLQAPAPVVTDALGFHHTTTHRQTLNAGATWDRYAAAADGPSARNRRQMNT